MLRTLFVAHLPQDLHDHHLYYRTSQAWSPIGQPTDTNSLETYNRTYKPPEMFDSVEGIGTTLEKSLTVGYLMSRDAAAFVDLPTNTPETWKKGRSCHLHLHIRRRHRRLAWARSDAEEAGLAGSPKQGLSLA